MVLSTINMGTSVNRGIELYMAQYGIKDKRIAIVKVLQERLKELKLY